jgi:hypothetical protein
MWRVLLHYSLNFLFALPVVYIAYQKIDIISLNYITLFIFIVGWLAFFQYIMFSLLKRFDRRWVYFAIGILVSIVGTGVSFFIYALIIGRAISQGFFP